ncbi:hypothetical protein BKA69DRAFT_1038835 [Paraphysoderma sedebokerense]|nr:hypothetical protein BKA69DRAFT_1038835 [Paraphysoderma sedebokerense]
MAGPQSNKCCLKLLLALATLLPILHAQNVIPSHVPSGLSSLTHKLVIRAGGSSFGGVLYSQWISAYNGLPKWGDSYKLNYKSSDSQIGRTMVLNDTYVFGGTDSEMSVQDIQAMEHGGMLLLPAVAGAIVVAYNIPELEDTPDVYLNLSRQLTANIFLGKVTKWNDPAVQALNPAIQMPNETINIVVRRDKSSTTYKFTHALSKFSDEFRTTVGASSLPNWVIQHYNATGNGGVSRAIHGFDYALGFVDVASALENHVPYATLINKEGFYTRAGYHNIESSMVNLSSSAMASVGNVSATLDLNDLTGNTTYPIVGMTYYLLDSNANASRCRLLRETARYLTWTYISPIATEIAHELSFAPLNAEFRAKSLAALKSISCQTGTGTSQTLWGQSVCDNGCAHGSCTYDYGFQPQTEVCKCVLGHKNDKKLDCSEEVVPTIMDFSSPLVTFIVILASLLVAATLVVMGVVFKYRDHQVIKGIYKVFRRIRALRSSISNRRLLVQSGMIIGANVVLLIVWYAIDIPRLHEVPTVDEMRLVCASDNPTVDAAMGDIFLIYHGLLIAATTFLAVKVRVAKDVFNEAPSIGISVYVAIFFVPISFISSINTQTLFLLRTLASIICGSTVLFALFGPKIIGIMRPDSRTKPGVTSTITPSSTQKRASASTAATNGTLPSNIAADYYATEFYVKKNGLLTVWKLLKVTIVALKDSPGHGLITFHDGTDSSVILHALRLQDAKLVCDEKLRSTGHSSGGGSSNGNNSANKETVTPNTGIPNFGRLMFADGYYDLEGKSPLAMATLFKVYSASTATNQPVATNARKYSVITSVIAA